MQCLLSDGSVYCVPSCLYFRGSHTAETGKGVRHANESTPLLGSQSHGKDNGSFVTADDTESLLPHGDDKADVIIAAGKNASLIRALAKSFGGPFVRGALYKVVQDLLTFIMPLVLE